MELPIRGPLGIWPWPLLNALVLIFMSLSRARGECTCACPAQALAAQRAPPGPRVWQLVRDERGRIVEILELPAGGGGG